MAALNYLHQAGLTVEAEAGKLRVSPVERITPEICHFIVVHKDELLTELSAANETTAAPVIRKLELAEVPAPGIERRQPLEEIAKPRESILDETRAPSRASSAWLRHVARLLGTQPAELLEGGHLEPHDLIEQADTDTTLVAELIRTSPAWINRPQWIEPQHVVHAEDKEDKPQCTVHTAATDSTDRLRARDQFYQHLMSCRACHAPVGRYCTSGSALRQHYNDTFLETNA